MILDYNLLVYNRGSFTNMKCGTSWFDRNLEKNNGLLVSIRHLT